MPALFIDTQKLKKNIQITKSCAGQAHIIGVIKGNGYGLGLCTYAHILIQSGIEILAVTEIEDAITLRNSGITCDIMLLSPLYRKEDLAQALSYHVILCISSFQCGEMIEQIAIERNMYARAQICVDTGLGRYGFPDTHMKEIIYTIQHMRHVCITGIYSHFYASACHNSYHTKTQLEHFTSLCDALEQENVFVGYRHIAASCALLRYPEARLDAVRIGSAFLGRIPIKDQWGYQAIGRLEAPISDIHTLPAGHNIGYGQTFTTRRKTTVAVVPAGYSHGLETKRNNDCPGITQLPRYIYHLLKNTVFPKQLCAYRGDTAFPVLGKIGMTNVIIDITGYNIKIGDIVSFPVNPIYVDSSIPRIYS